MTDWMEPIDIWRRDVGRHLNYIEAGADMVRRHVEKLVVRPHFETLAEAEMERTEKILAAALSSVRRARAEYEAKPHATDLQRSQ